MVRVPHPLLDQLGGTSEPAPDAIDWGSLLDDADRRDWVSDVPYINALQRAIGQRNFEPLMKLLDAAEPVHPALLPVLAQALRRASQTGQDAGGHGTSLTAQQDRQIRFLYDAFSHSKAARDEVIGNANALRGLIARMFITSESTIARSLRRTKAEALLDAHNSVRATHMHQFSELVDRGTSFALHALNSSQAAAIEALQTSGSTPPVKTLQAVSLQKAITAVGMLSIFEAMLQDALGCQDGFKGALDALGEQNANVLADRFRLFILAINVLKHGDGRSYEALLAEESLPFRVKARDEAFFDEGDVSEISTLVQVDDEFVLNCAALISEVSAELGK